MKKLIHLAKYLPTVALGRPLQSAEDAYRPVFIIGSGRSGTTLLRAIVCAHPDIHIPPETFVLRSLIKEYRRYSRLPWGVLLRVVLGKFEFSDKFSIFNLSLKNLYTELLFTEPKHQTLAFILNRFYLFHSTKFKPTAIRWGDKTPINTYGLDSIRSVFPDGLFVHMLRDGRDVVRSYLEMKRYLTVEEAANRWLKSVRAAGEFGRKHPESFLVIRYEELVRSTEEVTRRLCQFIGLDFRSAMTTPYRGGLRGMEDIESRPHLQNVRRPITEESVGRWRETFGEEEVLILKALLGPSLENLGYEL